MLQVHFHLETACNWMEAAVVQVAVSPAKEDDDQLYDRIGQVNQSDQEFELYGGDGDDKQGH